MNHRNPRMNPRVHSCVHKCIVHRVVDLGVAKCVVHRGVSHDVQGTAFCDVTREAFIPSPYK